MQTTLLGFAIVIILALVTALVGPLFVDWNRFRGEFETRASRLTGLDFRITGSLDARLLPTPTVVMQGIEFGRPNEIGSARARALRIEFGLGALLRGEWRVSEARIEGPEFAAGLDSSGRVNWPVPKVGFDPEGVSIERLSIHDGRAMFADAATGSRLAFEKLEFKGELRSLTGPVKGEGSVVAAGQHYPYRLSTSRIGEDGGVKVRLMVDPIDRPLTAEADISIWFDHGTPRFEGSVQFARPVGRAAAGELSLVTEPWRITSRVKGDSTAAVLEQIEFQHGPDERATKFRGSAQLKFGRHPRINGVLSSPQIDLDRVLALPETTRRRPLAAIKSISEVLTANLRIPIPTNLSIGIESVTLGGAMLQRLGAELELDAERLDITTLEFRAPGITQVRLSGRLDTIPGRLQFQGSSKIESNDPRALVAWLTDRSDGQVLASGPLRLAGDVALSGDAIAIERLKLELDRMTVAGRFGYLWGKDDRPARLEAALTAPEIDLDRVHAIAKSLLGDTPFDWPRQSALSLKIGRASVLGVQAKQVDVNMRIDGDGLEIDELAVADFGGAALAIKGRVDTKMQAPRGAVTLDLNARTLDGVLAVLEKFAPQPAEQLRRAASRVAPASLRASLTVDPGAAGNAFASAKFKLDGRAGTSFRLAFLGDASTFIEAFNADKAAALAKAKVKLSGRIESDDGAALVELVGLDRFISADKKPGRLSFAASGLLDGELEIDGQLAAGALNIATNGKARVSPRASPRADLDLKVSNANVRSPRPVAGGRPAELLPTSLSTRLVFAEDTFQMIDIKGTVAGTQVGGSLIIGAQQPIAIGGEIELGALDLTAAVATALGVPARGAAAIAGSSVLWPSEPFEQMVGPLRGQVAIRSARIMFTPKLEGRNFQGVVRFGDSQITLQATEASLAGGRLAGELIFLREPEGLIARTRIKLAGANAADLLPGEGTISGRLRLDIAAEGSGMSAVALIGSLAGSGTFTLENARVARLDPAAFNAVIRAVDQGLPIDPNRLRDKMDSALANAALAIPIAEGAITVDAGQARVTNSISGVQGTELALNANINLTEGAMDARLLYSAAGGAGAPANTRPEIAILLKGPTDAPKRSIDVATFASWLALRAVEQQSKKLDVLEGREALAPPAAPADPPRSENNSMQAAPATAPATPRSAGPEAPQQRPILRNRSSAPTPGQSSGEQIQPLPPPIDIRPAPAPRAPRAQSGAVGQQQKPPPATMPPRSLSEILFGN